MKAFIVICAISIGALGINGCAAHQPVVAAVIPNQTSALDGDVYRGLRDVEAALDTYKTEVANGSFVPTAAMTTAMANVTTLYNDTYALWVAYHAATAATQTTTGPALQAKYQSLQTSYQTAITSGAPLPATSGAK
jgi:hypothetical protein